MNQEELLKRAVRLLRHLDQLEDGTSVEIAESKLLIQISNILCNPDILDGISKAIDNIEFNLNTERVLKEIIKKS